MKKLGKYAAVFIILVVFSYLTVFNIFSARNKKRDDIRAVNANLRHSINYYPSIHNLIDDIMDDGERVSFPSDFSGKFIKNFDVHHLDTSCGRLFVIQEKGFLWGYNRTFIIHRDILKPIMIDNSSSQNEQIEWSINSSRELLESQK